MTDDKTTRESKLSLMKQWSTSLRKISLSICQSKEKAERRSKEKSSPSQITPETAKTPAKCRRENACLQKDPFQGKCGDLRQSRHTARNWLAQSPPKLVTLQRIRHSDCLGHANDHHCHVELTKKEHQVRLERLPQVNHR